MIDLIARTKQYSAALGNRPRDVGEGLGLHVTSTLPHRATQRCKLSLSWLQRGVFNGVPWCTLLHSNEVSSMVYSSSFQRGVFNGVPWCTLLHLVFYIWVQKNSRIISWISKLSHPWIITTMIYQWNKKGRFPVQSLLSWKY